VVEELVWEKGEFVRARIRARSGGLLWVKVQAGKAVDVDGVRHNGAINTTVGGVYRVIAAGRV
jgi:hypothetical protein